MAGIVILCLQLSHWQWHRYHTKQALTQAYQQQWQASPIPLAQALSQLPKQAKAPVFIKVTVTGQYDSQHAVVLDNRSQQGQAGYHILTPLRLADSPAVLLINRGFIPRGPAWQSVPDLQVSTKPVHLTGFLTTPSQGFSLGAAIETPSVSWPLRLARIDFAELRRHYSPAVLPYILLLLPQQTGAYACQWSYPPLFAERSLGYTFQWLALALITVILWFIISFKKVSL